jgi:asparagine synthase (glutamine-hydrolysing)
LLSLANKKGADFYLSATNDIFEDVYTFSNNKYIQEMDELVNSISDVSPLSKMLYLDSELLLFSDLLVKMDIATMANSLEGRSPFLSKYMLEFAPTIKDEYKINKLTTKYILRELASKYIPNELITQPKRGFEVPLRQWVDNELRENIYEALIGNAYSKEFVDSKFVDDVLHNRVDMSPDKRAKILWSMYCLEIWRKGI